MLTRTISQHRVLEKLGKPALTVAAIASWGLGDCRPTSEIPTEPRSVVNLTPEPGWDDSPSVSPDGSRIVHVTRSDGRDSDLWVRSIASGDRRQLTSGAALDFDPAWSPEGRQIAFFRARNWQMEDLAICLIPAEGGSERRVLDLEPSFWPGLSWFPDGRSLAFVDRDSESTPIGIFRLSLDSSEITPLTVPPEPSLLDVTPAVSPDGRRLAFVRQLRYGNADVWVQDIPHGTATPLTRETYEAVQGLAWTSDARQIIYGAKQGLWRIPVDGGTPLAIPEVAGVGGFPCVSPRGDRLLYVALSKVRNLWRFPGPKSTESERVPSLLIGSAHADWNADFSPDSTQVAFQSLRSGGVYSIWVSDADGETNLRQLTFREEHSATPRWSPDGEWIAFDSAGADTGMDLFVVRASGGTPRKLTTAPSHDVEPNWSPDGRWIYFRSDRSGQDQIWKMPIEDGVVTGQPVQITSNGGRFPRAAPDGRSVYYNKKRVSGIWRVPRDGGEETLVLDREIRPRAWDLAEGDLYFIDEHNSIEWSEIETGEVTPVLQREQDCYGLVVSPDEKWIVWGEQGRGQADIMLLEDFQ